MTVGIDAFSMTCGRPLRPYQLECARAIADSVQRRDGAIFTVMFARQMGKNETSAQLEAFLLSRYAGTGGTIVKAAPTFKPQTINSMLRLKEVLSNSPLTASRWQPQYGYMMRVEKAAIAFFSADKHANEVGTEQLHRYALEDRSQRSTAPDLVRSRGS